ncbi:MAG: Rieske 2Fe-2S domain-containing protein [Gemmataceae bacterium]
MLELPAADRFPDHPASWYYFCPSKLLRDRPLSRGLLGQHFVAYRTSSGAVAMLEGRCSHLGADLGKGCVKGDRLQCPFHNWEYGTDGLCQHIPMSADIPAIARQAVFPVVERHGHIYFYPGWQPRFDFPFFTDADPAEFVAARPFQATLNCPWYMIGANAFDLQHFRAAHDRRLVSDPSVSTPHPLARRASATFAVSGNDWQDRLTRWFAGDEVTMAITDWCGNLMFATATFRRTRSYGMVITEPLPAGKVTVRVLVHVPRRGPLDPLRLELRRFFIRRFLASDAGRLDGTDYHPGSLIEPDRDLAEYFAWLARSARDTPGRSAVSTNGHHDSISTGSKS